ncbi:hypothetical protein DH2020_009387 [Rehmannia glutinosa]|uniref:Uncharacterized protein n=1 Tax=Rehmannia glutinosa TaxID=99300 RepID=A0ABR0X6U7_REHGL
MAGSDSQKQLLTLIRDFSTEKSQGERRIVSQKKRIEELRSELDASNAELEEAKRDKEMTEQQLKGYEVELSMNEASIKALEGRISVTSNEISKLGSELAALKNCSEATLNGGMYNVCSTERHSTYVHQLHRVKSLGDSSSTVHEQDAQQARVVLQNKLSQIILQTDQEEEQYKAEQVIHDQFFLNKVNKLLELEQVHQELINLKKKALLLESVMKENMELQELSRYPWTSELEVKYAALGDELQQRFLCPRCHQDNSEELGEILQISDGS